MSSTTTQPLLVPTPGSHRGDFSMHHWLLMAVVSLIFGSAFLWIALALRSLAPTVVAEGRVVLGAAALALIPAARRRIDRSDMSRLVVAGIAGHALPALLFAFAEQHIASSTAGMLISGLSITTAAVGAILIRSLPTRLRSLGLLVGFGGVLLLSLPNLTGGGNEPLGVGLVLLSLLSYSIAFQLYVPLQHAYGALPVVMWSLVVASVTLLPLGLTGIGESTFEATPIAALVVLGVLGTGIVRTLSVSLLGKVGATRGSIVGYVIPAIALVLGVIVLDEEFRPIQVAGMAVALAGAYLVSKSRDRVAGPSP